MSKEIRFFTYKVQINQRVSRIFRPIPSFLFLLFLSFLSMSNSLIAKNTKKMVFSNHHIHSLISNAQNNTYSGFGCDSLIVKFSINNDTQCLNGNSFEFTNESTDSTGQTLSFEWYIQNTQEAITTDLDRIFATSGQYEIKLVAQNDSLCRDSFTQNIILTNLEPKIDLIGSSEQCFSGNQFKFIDSTQYDSITSPLIVRNWDLGGYKFSNDQEVEYSFPTDSDSINIQLELESFNGCKFDTAMKVKINPSPKAHVTLLSKQQVCFIPNAIDSSNYIKSLVDSVYFITNNQAGVVSREYWLIDNRDTISSAVGILNRELFGKGDHTVAYFVESDSGCEYDTVINVYFADLPKSVFTFVDSTLCLTGNRFEIIDSSSTDINDPVSLTKYFVESLSYTDTFYKQPSSGNIQFSVADVGVFKVYSHLETTFGCIDTSSSFVTVSDNPQASILANITGKCEGDLTSFDLQRKGIIGQELDSIFWYEGNTLLGNDSIITYTQNSPGIYYIGMKLVSPSGCFDSTTSKLIVQGKPQINISRVTPDSCVNNFLVLKGVSSNSEKINEFKWKFPDGTTSSDSVVTKKFSTGGSKEIQLITKVGKSDCVDSDTLKIQLFAAALPRIASSSYGKCFKGNQFVFTDSTKAIGSVTRKVTWKFADGYDTSYVPSSLFTKVKHSYNSTGKFNVTLTIINQYGCLDSVISTISVYATPTADFTIDNNKQCLAGNNFNFSDRSISNSISPALNHYWNFGDSTISTVTKPSKNYLKDGQKNICLVASNSFGCADTAYSLVQVIPQPVANFGINNSIQCVNKNQFVYTDSSKIKSGGGVIKLFWNFGDGSVSNSSTITKKYSTTGTIKTKLYATTTFGCIDSVEKSIKLMPKPKASFSVNNDTQCFVGNSFQFYNQSSIVNGGGSLVFQWNFGDANSSGSAHPNISYSQYGNYNVKLKTISQFGCFDSMIIPVLVTANPLVSYQFTKPRNQCNNIDTFKLANVTQALNGKGLVYKWDLGDGTISSSENVVKSFKEAGAYYIKLTATNNIGCIDSFTQKVQVYPDPIVDFSVNKNAQCIKGQNFQFTNNTTVGYLGGSLNYIWKYSDTVFANSLNASKLFNTVKSYSVKLITKTSNGCSDSMIKSVQVYASPIADFSISNAKQCLSNNVFKFSNNSYINVGNNSYSWSFDDGLGSGVNSPTKTYTTFGNYNVKLLSTSDNGCVDSMIKLVNVYSQPQVSFSKSDSAKCLYNNLFTFGAQSTNADGSSMQHKWRYGNVSTDTGKNVQKSFAFTGVYLVKLITTTNNNCADSVFTTVKIHAQPQPSFSLSSNSQCLAANSFAATNLSTIAVGGGTLSYGWKFGNGKSDVAKNPTWSYTSTNTYTVTLYAISSNFCTDSIKKVVSVNPNPMVSFNLSDTSRCLKNNEFKLTNTSAISSGTLYHDWDFGNLQKSSGTSPIVNYTTEGNYYIKLVAKSALGCADSVRKLVKVYAQPKASFAVNSQMQCFKGNYFQFVNNSLLSSGTLNYIWNFGDSSSSNVSNAKHGYKYPSNKVVKLIATSNLGCKDSATLPLSVKPNPKASFYVNDSIQCKNGNDFVFMNNSKISDGLLMANWNFGDNVIQSSFIGRHSYTNSGIYKVLLTMNSNFNCSDTISKFIKVTNQPVVAFTLDQNSSCFIGNNFKTNNSTTYSGTEQVNYTWRFSDGDVSFKNKIDKSFSTDGKKSITLYAVTSEGCADSLTKTVIVFPQGKSQIQLFDTIQCLKGNKFTFGNLSRLEGENFAILSWNYGDGTIDTVLTVKPVMYEYYDTGFFKVELITTTENLCQDKSSGYVRVVPMPKAAYTQSAVSYCQNDQHFEFSAKSVAPNVVLSKWEVEKKTIQNIDTLKYTFGYSGKYNVKYILFTDFGCSDTARTKAIVNESPIAKILSDKIEQCLENNRFNFTNLSSGNSVPDESWIFHDGPFLDLRTGSTQEVVFEYSGKQLVELIVENDSSCIDTATTFVTVNPFASANIDVANVCQNTSSKIKSNATISSGNIRTYEWNLGDGRNTIDSAPNHKYAYPGKYYINLTLKSDKGCQSKFRDSTIIFPNPIARILTQTPRATILQDTIQFMDSSDNAATYEWIFGDAANSMSYESSPKNGFADTGNFNVQLVVTSADGCNDTAMKTVRVWPDFNLLFPTAFSPNLDNLNDDYNVVGHFHSIKNFIMTIYDQNGIKVFETTDIKNAWNGKIMNEGKELPSGSYETIVRVQDLYNKQYNFTKKISLVR